MSIIDIITGEKIQQLAHIYVGYNDDFKYNPLIANQNEKQLSINLIPNKWDNPTLIFCHSHCLSDFIKKIDSITNKCILLIGNSDHNITYELCKPLLNNDMIYHIFSQNISFNHEKVSILPIGLANSQWNHGNLELFNNCSSFSNTKKNMFFCSFNVNTNFEKRNNCIDILKKNNIINIKYNNQYDYLVNLAISQYSICPTGNGLDTHRFWESLYYKTIPIALKNEFTLNLKEKGFPCILLNSWDEISTIDTQDYNNYIFDNNYFYNISFMKLQSDILNKVSKIEKSMNVVLSFIGKMPSYIEECIKQLRLFFDGPIYLIYNDIDNTIKNNIELYNINFINYDNIRSERFDFISKNKSFCVVDRLEDRRELFKASYERIYLLENLILKYNLENIWFMEIDILMYTNPNIFFQELKNKPYAYFYHDKDHCCSAILYVKDYLSMQPIMESLDSYNNGFMSEMKALYYHYSNHNDDYLLPIINNNVKEPYPAWKNFGKLYNCIFDGATKGQFLFGVDKIHTNNVIIRNDSSKLTTHIPFWNYGQFLWYKNQNGLNIPYFKDNFNNIMPIVNLHIHSKDLISAVSYTNKN